jgi:hypothetical protein
MKLVSHLSSLPGESAITEKRVCNWSKNEDLLKRVCPKIAVPIGEALPGGQILRSMRYILVSSYELYIAPDLNNKFKIPSHLMCQNIQ